MSTETKHTPGSYQREGALVLHGDAVLLLVVGPDEGIADKILAILNSHASLISTCEALRRWYEMPGSCDIAWPATLKEAVDKCRAAIAEAT